MNLLRQRTWTSWLALLAMTAQFAFSFSHLHLPHDHVDGWFLSASRTLIGPSGHSDRLYETHAGFDGHGHRAPGHDHDEDQDDCPVCWVHSVAGALVLADNSPALEIPRRNAVIGIERYTLAVSAYSFASYQIRAPPPAMIV